MIAQVQGFKQLFILLRLFDFFKHFPFFISVNVPCYLPCSPHFIAAYLNCVPCANYNVIAAATLNYPPFYVHTTAATLMGTIEVSPIADLEQVRGILDKQFRGRRDASGVPAAAGDDNGTGNGDHHNKSSVEITATSDEKKANEPRGGGGMSLDVGGIVDGDQLSATLNKLSSDWCFVDSCTAERFFRVDRAQEHLHYLTDIANESLYVLDQDCPTMPPTPEDELVVQNALLQHQQMQNVSPSESR